MALPGDATVQMPFMRTDHSTINAPKILVKPSETKKTAVFPSSSSTTGFSVNTTRALTVKPRKIKHLRRRKRANEVMATIPQAAAIGPVSSRPKHLDLLEAVALREPRSQPFASSYCIETLNPGSGSGLARSNTGQEEEQSPGLGSEQVHRHMGYNEYLAQTSGRSRESTGKSSGKQEQLMKAGPSSSSRQSHISTASMEVCFRMSAKEPLPVSAKKRRPKIHLTIPRTRSHSYSVMPHQVSKERPSTRSQNTPNSVSPPSTTTRQRIDSELPARLSIVSPLSFVEMPKPRRPFSKFSFEDITASMSDSTPLLLKSASSESSDDMADLDDRSSNYSSRSSVSSLSSDPAVKPIDITRGSVAFSIISPTAAGVFDSMPLNPPFPKHPRAMRSTTFLSDKIDRNKPLPPAPGSESVRPLAFSRTSSMRSRGKAPPPLLVSRQSSVNVSRTRESQGMSLRSRYTPADLDALDDAFQKSSPPYLQPPMYASQNSPTLSQAELALEAHLGTINEDAPLDYDFLSFMHDPLQISRGPMQMEPSRKPPALPQFQVSGEGSLDPRKKLQKKPSTHVVLQMRAGSNNARKRTSVSLIGSSIKADKVLGRSHTGNPMVRDGSANSNWSSSESPEALTSSSNMSAEDSDTPESDLSSVPDTTFEEVRQRLELLSPKDDASLTFLAFHESIHADESATKISVPEQNCICPPAQETQPPVIILERHASLKAEEAAVDPTPAQASQGPPIQITAARDDGMHPLHRRRLYDEMSVRSVGSIAVSEIPDIYASLPSPKSTRQQSLTEEEVERMISAEAAEHVLLRILESLDNLQDLFNTATVSRGFYRTFKHHELPLMKNALFGMSPAAWELREMSPPHPGLESTNNASPKLGYTPSLYLQHYMRDMYIMIALKSMILIHCESFLRADTITALAGGETERASQIDDAFWRVWTFCRLFGCGTNREDDIIGQMDWLRGGALARQQRRKTSIVSMGADVDTDSITVNAPAGFGQGNNDGLTAEDLYDMTEIWTCLGVLVRGFQGKRKEARDYGVFEKSNITPGDVEQEDVILGMFSS